MLVPFCVLLARQPLQLLLNFPVQPMYGFDSRLPKLFVPALKFISALVKYNTALQVLQGSHSQTGLNTFWCSQLLHSFEKRIWVFLNRLPIKESNEKP